MDTILLKVDEVATLLQVDRQRVYELVRTNKIPVVKIGERQYRFSKSAIEAWLGRGGNLPQLSEEGHNNV